MRDYELPDDWEDMTEEEREEWERDRARYEYNNEPEINGDR